MYSDVEGVYSVIKRITQHLHTHTHTQMYIFIFTLCKG